MKILNGVGIHRIRSRIVQSVSLESTNSGKAETKRTDIQAWRGFAVLNVLFFHLFPNIFCCGYLGVDTFFVISGYLITKIHDKNGEKNLESFFLFLGNRLKRIVPAMAVCLFLFLIFSAVFMIPKDVIKFCKEMQLAVIFYSNYPVESNRNYFRRVREHRFLLHTWSLSVEIQYYVISVLPMLLLNKRLSILNYVVFLSSLTYYVINKLDVVFYSTFARLWQFLAGTFASECEKHKIAETSSTILKLLLIIVFLFLFLFEKQLTDLLPDQLKRIIITILFALILINPIQWDTLYLCKYVFCVFEAAGEISYSLYLLHWPIIVGVAYFYIPITVWSSIIVTVICIYLATLSTIFIETPIQKQKWSVKKSFAVTSIYMAIMIKLSFLLQILSGLPERLPNAAQDILRKSNETYLPSQYVSCASRIDNFCTSASFSASKQNMVVWGDSHALGVFYSLQSTYISQKRNIIFLGEFACNPCLESAYLTETLVCRTFNKRVLRKIQNLNVSEVMVVGYFSAAYQQILTKVHNHEAATNIFSSIYQETINTLLRSVRKVFIFYPIPDYTYHVPDYIIKSYFYNWKEDNSLRRTSDFLERNHGLIDALNKVECERCLRIYAYKFFCSQFECETFIKYGNKMPLYFDSNHFNEYGWQILAKNLNNTLLTYIK